MTDNLTNKFQLLEDLLAEQHDALMAVLSNILAQLGGAPPSGTVTLSDVVAAIAQSNSILVAQTGLMDGLEGGVGTISAAIATSNSRLSSILSDTTAIRGILQSTDFCCGETTPELFPPPLSNVPIPNGLIKCQNAQLTLDIILSIVTYMQQIISSAVVPSTQQIYQLFSQDSRLDNCPKPSQAELSVMVADIMLCKDALAADLPAYFSDVMPDLQQMLFNVPDAETARSGWTNIITGNVSEPSRRALLSDVIYNGLFNCLFSLTSGLDGSAYDGGLCETVIIDCITTDSVLIDTDPAFGYPTREQGVFTQLNPIASMDYGLGFVVTYSSPAIMTSNLAYGELRYVSGRVRAVWGNAGVTLFSLELLEPDDIIVLPGDTNFLILDDAQGANLPGTGAFTVQFCPGNPE